VKYEIGIAVLQSVEHFACMSEIWILLAHTLVLYMKLARFFGALLDIIFCLHILHCLKLARFFGAWLHIIIYCLHVLCYLKLARFFGASLKSEFGEHLATQVSNSVC